MEVETAEISYYIGRKVHISALYFLKNYLLKIYRGHKMLPSPHECVVTAAQRGDGRSMAAERLPNSSSLRRVVKLEQLKLQRVLVQVSSYIVSLQQYVGFVKQARLELEQYFFIYKSVTSTSAWRSELFLSCSSFPQEEAQAAGEQLTDNRRRARIYFNNKQTHYGKSNVVWYYRGEITRYHPLCSHAQRGVRSEREGGRRRRRREAFWGIVWKRGWPARRQAALSAGPGERALVIWSARRPGLSSETRRGEVGDRVWGPPSCYCP